MATMFGGYRTWPCLCLLATGGCFLLPIGLGLQHAADASVTPIGTPAAGHFAMLTGVVRSDSDWEPADALSYLAVDADSQLGDGPIWLTTYYGVGYSDEVPARSTAGLGSTTTVDFAIGLRHYQSFGRVEPFLGVGGAFVDRRYSHAGGVYDYSVGLYGEAGLEFALAERVAIGVLARHYLGTDQRLDGLPFEADCTTLGVMLVFRR